MPGNGGVFARRRGGAGSAARGLHGDALRARDARVRANGRRKTVE